MLIQIKQRSSIEEDYFHLFLNCRLCIVVYVPKIHLYSHEQTWCIINLNLPLQRPNWIFRPLTILVVWKIRILQSESKACHVHYTWEKKLFDPKNATYGRNVLCLHMQFWNKNRNWSSPFFNTDSHFQHWYDLSG